MNAMELMDAKVTVLAGGVGAARFLSGLVHVVPPEQITVVCNVSDDFAWHGLYVCPDIDTITYTLAGAQGTLGWGLEGDSHAALESLRRLGGEAWFGIGDRDLGTHLYRTQALREGKTLTEVTAHLARAWGVALTLLPVTDQPHPTVILTDEGELPFQVYFVQRRGADTVREVRFPMASKVRPAAGVIEAITRADVLVVAPSNPFVSIDPLLAVPGVRAALAGTSARRIAVSPIVGGAAIKGPAADMMRSLGHEVSAVGVARLYAGLVDCFVLDQADAALVPEVAALGLHAVAVDTMMLDPARTQAVARAVLQAATS